MEGTKGHLIVRSFGIGATATGAGRHDSCKTKEGELVMMGRRPDFFMNGLSRSTGGIATSGRVAGERRNPKIFLQESETIGRGANVFFGLRGERDTSCVDVLTGRRLRGGFEKRLGRDLGLSNGRVLSSRKEGEEIAGS